LKIWKGLAGLFLSNWNSISNAGVLQLFYPQLVYLLPHCVVIGGLKFGRCWVTVVLASGLPGSPVGAVKFNPLVVLAGGMLLFAICCCCALAICCCTARKLDAHASIRNISPDPNAIVIIWCCLIIRIILIPYLYKDYLIPSGSVRANNC
jgi:hypothetical protein